jgi:hypothetical protein
LGMLSILGSQIHPMIHWDREARRLPACEGSGIRL